MQFERQTTLQPAGASKAGARECRSWCGSSAVAVDLFIVAGEIVGGATDLQQDLVTTAVFDVVGVLRRSRLLRQQKKSRPEKAAFQSRNHPPRMMVIILGDAIEHFVKGSGWKPTFRQRERRALSLPSSW
jgi:hypothetical protein